MNAASCVRRPRPVHLAILLILATLDLGCSAHYPSVPNKSDSALEEPTAERIGQLDIGGCQIQVVNGSEGAFPLPAGLILDWVKDAATALNNYYGRFPVKRLTIVFNTEDGAGVSHGVAFDGRLIHLTIGAKTRKPDLTQDWKLTHEMFHLGFPDLGEQYLYMNEGLSDYLEPIARCRVGNLSAAEVWEGFVEGIPQGLPGPGDRGLDFSRNWGRVYWGGALFWLVADVRVRQRTQNQRSLDDAVRAILRAGGDGSKHWDVNEVIRIADAATGTPVLAELHEQMGEHGWAPDLDALWRQLGVSAINGRITFDDNAPLARVRRAITRTN